MNEKSKRGIANVLAVLASLLLIFCLLFVSLYFVMGDRNWFYNEYSRLGTSQQTGLSNEDMTEAVMRLVDYMKGSIDTIDLDVTENGNVVSMYNDRERLHMLDVRALFLMFQTVCMFGAFLCMLFIAAVIVAMRREAARVLSRSFLIGAGIFAVIVAGVGIYMAIDFNSFWTSFHHLFFTNDLWLLSYATDRMIRICPGELFFDIILRLGVIFLVVFAVLAGIAGFTLHITKRGYFTGKNQ